MPAADAGCCWLLMLAASHQHATVQAAGTVIDEKMGQAQTKGIVTTYMVRKYLENM